MLQHEFGMKRNVLENIPHVKEWCDKAGVTLQIDVKAGYAIKSIVVDEAKAIGAYHVVLDRTMKSDRKYFVENLTCFVSRARASGGVDTIRSFSVSKQLPPLVPTPPNTVLRSSVLQMAQPILTTDSTTSLASLGSNASNHSNHSNSSGSFDIGASSDGFLTQDSDLFSAAPTTGESLDEAHTYRSSIPLRASALANGSNVEKIPAGGQRLASETGYNLVNRKPTLRKWLAEEDQMQQLADAPPYDNSNSSSLHDRPHKILGPAPVVDQVRRTPMTFLEKSVHAPPLPPAPPKLTLPPGRTSVPENAPEKVTTLPAPPLSRMPSPPHSKLSQTLHKTVWVWTRSKEVMRAAVEVGWTTFVFTPDTKFMAPQWTTIEWIKPLFLEGGRFLNQEGKQVALLGQVYSGEQLDYLPAMMGGAETVVINDLDWQIIPPEDVVAAFQGRRTNLFATATTASDAQVYLEALEVGMDGVVLHTENIAEIGALRDYLAKKKIEKERAIEWAIAEPPIKEVSELRLDGPEEEEQQEQEQELAQEHEHEQYLAGLTPEHSMTRSEHSMPRSESSHGVHRVASSPRSDSNPLDLVSSPRIMDRIPSNSSTLTAYVPPQPQPQPPPPPPPAAPGLCLANATVKSVVSVGEGDRVSVDLCNLLNPGEALLVGSFSKGMFLVHSEVQTNNTSRKSFRVNAGPVHAYTGMAGRRITYLSELESGGQVLAVDAHGNSRTVLVGRVSIESKPLVLIVVEVGGKSFSVMLQESDSVRLVIPAEHQRPGREAIAVTKLQQGDVVVLSMEDAAAYEQ
ncbi:hypothetical protein KC19_2G060800 [Ceratodon purpureus]|nr:hypothetical protein KC19_2G060800 [Ceratodon purpureus]